MQSRSLLEGKTTELKQFLKSIIFNPQNCNKNIAFLFVLSIDMTELIKHESENFKGLLTYKKISDVLLKMKPDKSPGIIGF